MNLTPARRLTVAARTAVLLAAVCAPLASATPAAAQLDSAVKSDPNARESQQAIRAFVEEQVSALRSGNPTAVTAAREALRAEYATGTPSPAFRSAYAAALDNRLAPALADADLLAKLNAAVVVTGLAEAAGGTELTDSTLALLRDENPVIARWGIEAAGGILPAAMAAAGGVEGDPLVPAIAAAASQRFPDNGAVAAAAYEALGGPLASNTAPAVTGPTAAQAVPHLAGGMLTVLETRNRLYSQALPEQTEPDAAAARVLARPPVAQRLRGGPIAQRTVQTFADLLALLATRRADPDTRARGPEVNGAIANVGLSLAAFVDDDEVRDVGRRLGGQINQATPPQTVQELVDTMLSTVQQAVPGLRAPGTLPTNNGAAPDAAAQAQ